MATIGGNLFVVVFDLSPSSLAALLAYNNMLIQKGLAGITKVMCRELLQDVPPQQILYIACRNYAASAGFLLILSQAITHPLDRSIGPCPIV